MNFNQTRTPSPTDEEICIIYPRCTFIRQCCFLCGNTEYKIYLTDTEHPRYIFNICDDKKCLDSGREGMRKFLYSNTTNFPIENIENVIVKRSDGQIENDWVVIGLWLYENEFPDIYVKNIVKCITKNIRGSEFLQYNPELENIILDSKNLIIEKHLKII